jgi:hypothetical protein
MKINFFKKRPKRKISPNIVRLNRNKKPKITFNKNHKRKIFAVLNRLRFLFIFLFFVLVSGFLFFSSYFKIQNLSIKRDLLSNNLDLVQTEVSQEYFGKNIFFVKKAEIKDYVLKKFNYYQDIEVLKEYPNSLKLKLKSYPPFLKVNYNFKKAEDEIIKKQVIINEKGRLVSNLLEDTSNLLELNYQKEVEKDFLNGETLIILEDIEFLKSAKLVLEEDFEYLIKEIKYFPDGRELRFDVILYDLWLDLEGDLENQFNKLRLARQKLKGTPLNYIDLRISNRIIYQEKE